MNNQLAPFAALLLASAVTSGLTQEPPAPVKIPDTFPPHPRILFTKADVEAIRKKAQAQPWAKARLDSLKREADDWLK